MESKQSKVSFCLSAKKSNLNLVTLGAAATLFIALAALTACSGGSGGGGNGDDDGASINRAIDTSGATDQNTVLLAPQNPNVVNPNSFYNEARPGESFSEDILISNYSDEIKIITLTPLDGTAKADSAPSFKLNTAEQSEFGAWANLSENSFTLEPGTKKTVTMTVAIPGKAEQKTYIGGLQFDAANLEQQNETSEPIGTGIKQDVRTVKIIAFKITDNPTAPLKLSAQNPANAQIYFAFSAISFIIALIILFSTRKKNQDAK